MKASLLFLCLFVSSSAAVLAQGHRERDPLDGIDIMSLVIGLVIGVIVGYLLGTRMTKK